jgi:diketogulonate reductase-like aldo/keto reductase
MNNRQFGYTEKTIPIIGQGTWQVPEAGSARKEAIASLRRGIELGLTHIDTAEMYGRAEEVIQEAITGLNRQDLFIVSKVLPSNANYVGTINALEKSLKRLKLDYLDCYLLHWRGNIPLSETLAAMEKLEKDGKIRSFGVSNFDVDDLEEAIECLTLGKLACNQVLYNLENRGIERKLIPFCQKNEIALVGYTPFGTIPGARTAEYQVLNKIAGAHDATVRQVVLAFLTRLDGTFTIPKASRLQHVEENAGALSLKLTAGDIAEIDALYPAPKRDVPLGMI